MFGSIRRLMAGREMSEAERVKPGMSLLEDIQNDVLDHSAPNRLRVEEGR